ncbi:L-ascorbate oxidase [Citrus sinensis]|nr:L-ascorbate oxidase [Citrus sinensis]
MAEARIRRYKWEVKYEYKSPDCFRKVVITINGRTPGPTIQARQNDTVIVELKNSLLTENVAIHWHGIRQIGTPWADGTEGVTQCPILPGETFTYKFVVDRPGTYLYHAHYGMQREAGLYGSIRVSLPEGESEPYAYDYDRSIILNDWFHRSAFEQAAGLSSIPFQWVGEPQGHNMTVVEADGHNVEPFVVQNLFIYSGETYSVLIKADQNPTRNYWATTNIVSRNATFTTPPGLAILNYYPNHPKRSPPTTPPSGPLWNDVGSRLNQSLAIKARKGFIVPPPQSADRMIVMLNTQNNVSGNVRWSVNKVTYTLPHIPYLIALKENITSAFDQTPPPDGYDFKNYDIFSVAENKSYTIRNGVYRLNFNSTVDIILQNANSLSNKTSETHPWHLHGHDFWVLGYGEGKFDIYNDPKKYNLVNPIMKNTVPVHRYGWTALRFRADNPGAWAFHCHIESHFYMGMGVVFAEGIERLGELPSSIKGCVHRK